MELQEFEDRVIVIRDKLFRFANRLLGNQPEAEDAMQDILVKLWLMKERLPGYRNVEALAMTMTRNLCLDRIRQRKPSDPMPNGLIQQQHLEPDRYVEGKDLQKQIARCIARLPEIQQTVIHLRDVEGYSFEEMETLLDMSRNALRVNLSRARKRVRDEMTELEHDEHT